MEREGKEKLTRVVTWQQRAIEGAAHDEVFVPRECSLVRVLPWSLWGRDSKREEKKGNLAKEILREKKDIHSIPLTVSSLKS
jgi:hypothetical protein